MKQKIVAIIVALGLALIALFYHGLYSPKLALNQASTSQPQEIKITSTNPNPLDNATVLPTQTMEISFNQPLLNKDEFKYTLDPKVEIKTEVSSDLKTIKLTPVKGFEVGQGFTLIIKPDSNFSVNGQKTPLSKELIYHFKTISYRGA